MKQSDEVMERYFKAEEELREAYAELADAKLDRKMVEARLWNNNAVQGKNADQRKSSLLANTIEYVHREVTAEVRLHNARSFQRMAEWAIKVGIVGEVQELKDLKEAWDGEELEYDQPA